MRRLIGLATLIALASCVAPPSHAPAPTPTPQPFRPVARPAPTYPDAPPRLDWRDIPLTPGRWLWRGGAGAASLSQYGEPGQPPLLALRCDLGRRIVVFERSGSLGGAVGSMTVTTSFVAFTTAARDAGSTPPVIVAEFAASDPRLDQVAFSRGRFLIDEPGQMRLVVPSWPEAARVIEDCRA